MNILINNNSTILTPNNLIKLLDDAIKYGFIKNIQKLGVQYNSDENEKDKLNYIIGKNIVFKFLPINKSIVTGLEIILIDKDGKSIKIFSKFGGWLFKSDEIPQRKQIIEFLTTVYNKVEKKNKIMKDKKLEQAREEKLLTIEKLKNTKLVDFC